MPSTPRGRDAATLLAVVLAIALALAWLRSSDGGAPQVPAGLSVETVPVAAPEEPVAPSSVAPPTEGIEGKRAGGGEAARPHRKADARLGRRDRIRQGPRATAPAHSAGSGTAAVPSGGSGATNGSTAAPEFALE